LLIPRPTVFDSLPLGLANVVPKSEEVRASASNLTELHIRQFHHKPMLGRSFSSCQQIRKFVANMLLVGLRLDMLIKYLPHFRQPKLLSKDTSMFPMSFRFTRWAAG
jgi:hypothetical protein